MENNTNQPNNSRVTPPFTISIQDAITRASNWRALLQSIPADPSNPIQEGKGFVGIMPDNMLFRAVNIRMADIQNLWNMHPEAVGVRLYMSVIDPDNPYHITGMLVPVDAQNQDILTTPIDGSLSEAEIMTSTTVSSIYDFTTPCPSMCNVTSPLFNQSNSPAPYFNYKKE